MANLENPRLAGSPIIFAVAAPARTGVAFQRIVLDVTVSSSDEREASFQFSSPTVGGETVNFDVSSAVRALAERHTPTPTGFTYPSYSLTIKATEEYMIDGVIYPNVLSEVSQTGKIYSGAYTDAERLFDSLTVTWSRKPGSSPELCFINYRHIVPGTRGGSIDGSWTDPSVTTVIVPAGRHPGINIYGIPAPDNGYELRFINSLGVHENVFLTCLATEETNYQTDEYTISRQETITEFSRRLALKQNDHEVWHMSSPVLDHLWLQWYLHEVLTARWVWLGIGNYYVPVNILPGDTVKGRDRQKADLLTVEFDLVLDINGSPMI